MSTVAKGMNSDIAQLENYIGHGCVAGVKVLLLLLLGVFFVLLLLFFLEYTYIYLAFPVAL